MATPLLLDQSWELIRALLRDWQHGVTRDAVHVFPPCRLDGVGKTGGTRVGFGHHVTDIHHPFHSLARLESLHNRLATAAPV